MAKRQLTLGAFGFTKKIAHRGNLNEVVIPRTVKEEKVIKRYQCHSCDKRFFEKKALIVHEKCKHGVVFAER